MKKIFFLSTLLSYILLFTACDTDYKQQDDELLQQYIQDNNLNAISAQDGLYYTIDVIGTGIQATSLYSTVTVNYTGYMLDGSIFDSNSGASPLTFSLSQVIKGWQYGIPYFKEGGKGKLLIPSHLAYGSSGSGSIPPNTPLVFEIDLITVQN
ncbi:MAG: FKBP-type peptidyl-prolyl cis-trans isomerase [Saprospiraceae bacterium]|nr:FKBP-type peptidyl-prolyl cis-trans isomerase [Saprospiraceae bacterium]